MKRILRGIVVMLSTIMLVLTGCGKVEVAALGKTYQTRFIEYSIDRIKQRIDEEYIKRVPFIEEYGNKKKYNANYYKKRKPKGFYALYIHYCYLLRVFPKKYPYQKLSPAIRADVRKMEEISNETRLLVRNNLKTDEQFFAFKEDKEKRLEELMDLKL